MLADRIIIELEHMLRVVAGDAGAGDKLSRSLPQETCRPGDVSAAQSSALLKINHYPPQHNPTTVSNIGVVPHSDEGGFTILWQDSTGGLEVESKGGEWVVAPPIEETFVINLGDAMQIWTNGEFSSTPHRVINRSGVDRYSIPFFVSPRWDVPVKPLLGSVTTPGSFEETFEQYQSKHHRRIFPVAFA